MNANLPTSQLKSTVSPVTTQAPRTAAHDEGMTGVTKAMNFIDLASSPSPTLNSTRRQSRSPNRGDRRAGRGGPKSVNLPNTEVRDAKVMPSEASGGIPNPTVTYLVNSSMSPQLISEPQHLLVVIDLNGTLLFRPNRKNPTKFTARPHTQRFLRYCIDTFTVVIWSSARPENVRNMCDAILSPDMRRKVAAIWGREKFDLTKEDYNARVQCYKRLTKLWADPAIVQAHPAYAEGGRWDQTNTVLVDDSLEKGRSEPFNLIEIPEFFGDHNEEGQILPQVHDFLNYLAMHSNVSACLRATPFRPLSIPVN
jgi:hypothetical protein